MGKFRKKRKDYTDGDVLDAINATNGSIPKAAEKLGIASGTLYDWIRKSDNLSCLINRQREMDALLARDKLNYMLNTLDAVDPKYTGHIISICKIMLDKVEADKSSIVTNNKIEVINHEIEAKINRLLNADE